MKKLTSLLLVCLLVSTAKSQTPTLSTLIRYVNIPVADLTEEVISIDGWELAKSDLVDGVVTLQFEFKDATLLIKKIKNYKNEVFLVCNKLNYDKLNQSLLKLKPKLISSEVNKKGHVVKTYWGEKYGYSISIVPKSLFVFQVYDRADASIKKQLDSLNIKTSSSEEENIHDSGFGETPLALRQFSNLVIPDYNGQKTGKIAVRIKIDKDGNVIDATPGVRGTTLNDRDLWQKCAIAIMKAKINTYEYSPSILTGIVVFNFKVK